MITGFMSESSEEIEGRDENRIYSREIMTNMMSSMSSQIQINNLEAFKEFLEDPENEIRDSISAIQYVYDLNINVFRTMEYGENLQVNPSGVMANFGMETDGDAPMGGFAVGPMAGGGPQVWEELLDNEELLRNQHDLLAGRFPESHNEVVLIVNQDNTVSDFTLYALGLRDQNDLAGRFARMQAGEELPRGESVSFSTEELLGLEFRLVLETDFFGRQGNIWVDQRENTEFMNQVIQNAEIINVVGIIKPNENSVMSSSSPGVIGYTSALTRHVIERIKASEIVVEQKENPAIDVFSGMPFPNLSAMPEFSLLSEMEQMQIMNASRMLPSSETNLALLGVTDISRPNSIRIFPANFEGKENITNAIDAYNEQMRYEGREEDVINYTDLIGLMMNSITTIINMISYVLIAFVGISLVVSSIMIGIITYISVLERTKEIGILRSIGASKKDISRVFNAETLIIGAVAGLIGIGVTLLLIIPANIIIYSATDVANLARLPWLGAAGLIAVSMLLTVVAGLIPSKLASKKDPVVALRTD